MVTRMSPRTTFGNEAFDIDMPACRADLGVARGVIPRSSTFPTQPIGAKSVARIHFVRSPAVHGVRGRQMSDPSGRQRIQHTQNSAFRREKSVSEEFLLDSDVSMQTFA